MCDSVRLLFFFFFDLTVTGGRLAVARPARRTQHTARPRGASSIATDNPLVLRCFRGTVLLLQPAAMRVFGRKLDLTSSLRSGSDFSPWTRRAGDVLTHSPERCRRQPSRTRPSRSTNTTTGKGAWSQPGPAHARASHLPHRGRLIHPSVYLPLADEAFMAGFEARWGEHVDFGTSRSHKKKGKAKAAQPVEWTLDASGNPVEKTRDVAPPPKKQRPAKAAPSEDARGRPRERVKTQATNAVLTSKGRFAGTLAASLLGGASAGKT